IFPSSISAILTAADSWNEMASSHSRHRTKPSSSTWLRQGFQHCRSVPGRSEVCACPASTGLHERQRILCLLRQLHGGNEQAVVNVGVPVAGLAYGNR